MSLSSNQLRLNNTAPSSTFCTTQHTFASASPLLYFAVKSLRVPLVPQHSILSKGSRHVCTRAHVHTHALQHSIFEVISVTSIAHNFNNQTYFMVSKDSMEESITSASSVHSFIHMESSLLWLLPYISLLHIIYTHVHTVLVD